MRIPILQKAINYLLASKGSRFANYIIDMIVLYILVAILGAIYYAIIGLSDPESFEEVMNDSSSNALIEYLFGAMCITIYYTIFEFLLKGKTLGKFITKTRAVTIDNERLSLNDAFARSICRAIPFEAFSFLGEKSVGWHDSISKTKVIQDVDWNEENFI